MTRWSWIAVLLWLGVVAGGAGGAWFAIDRAGRAVTDTGPGSSVLGSGAVATLPTAGSTGPSATATSGPTRSPGPTHQSPTPTPTPRPSASGSAADPGPATQQRIWSGSAGTVSASCTGSRLRLIGASPADGWHAERGDSGEVTFERGETEVKVRVRCKDGVPVFESRSESSSESEPRTES